jgi:hypothetical protein
MMRKTFTAFVFPLLLLLLNSNIFSQTIIKERVGIDPVVKLSSVTTEDYSPIAFQFGGPRPFSFVIESPSGSVSGSNAGWGAPPSVIDVPAINGNYKVTVSSSCECNTNVGYSVTWLDPSGYTNWIAGYEMWFWFGGVKVDSFKFNRIPAPPPPQEEIKIKIDWTGNKDVWPSLPKGQSNIEGYNPTTNAMITVTKGTLPVANQRVKISIKRIEGTGGHDHTAIPLEAGKSGTIKVRGNRSNPQIVVTNSNGEYLTEEILSSEFGGKYILEAALESNSSIKDTVHIIVKVPELVELESNTSIYELVGTPDNYSLTNDPCRATPPKSKHYFNHFGTQNLIASLINISSEYNKKYLSIRLRVNDMSLKYGGLFDWINNWESPHKLHRLGKNADVGFTGIDSNNRCVSLSKRFLYKLIQDITQIIPLEESDHFHIYTW